MYTALILAGGFSSRMGQDKAFMHGGIPRLTKELRQSGCSKIVVLCGSEERGELFDEECWPDPEDADCLAEVIRWAINKLEGVIQFVPCDAFLVSSKFFTEMSIGVPLDSEGRRQPLLARIEKRATSFIQIVSRLCFKISLLLNCRRLFMKSRTSTTSMTSINCNFS